eukprot:UN02193
MDFWICDACTMQNKLEDSTCTMCNTTRSTAGMIVGWKCDFCAQENPPVLQNCNNCFAKKPNAQVLSKEPVTETEEVKKDAYVFKLGFDFVMKICENLDNLKEKDIYNIKASADLKHKKEDMSMDEIAAVFKDCKLEFDKEKFEKAKGETEVSDEEMVRF